MNQWFFVYLSISCPRSPKLNLFESYVLFQFFFTFVGCLLMPPLILFQRFRSIENEKPNDNDLNEYEGSDVHVNDTVEVSCKK